MTGARWVLLSPLATRRYGRQQGGPRGALLPRPLLLVLFERGLVFLFLFPFSFVSGGGVLVWSVGCDSQALGLACRRSCCELGRPGCLTTWSNEKGKRQSEFGMEM